MLKILSRVHAIRTDRSIYFCSLRFLVYGTSRRVFHSECIDAIAYALTMQHFLILAFSFISLNLLFSDDGTRFYVIRHTPYSVLFAVHSSRAWYSAHSTCAFTHNVCPVDCIVIAHFILCRVQPCSVRTIKCTRYPGAWMCVHRTPAKIYETTSWIRSVLHALAIYANKNLIAIYLSEE